MSYAQLTDAEARDHRPVVILCDEANRPHRVEGEPAGATAGALRALTS
jgi:aspartate 1-decarboxylase